MIIKYKPYANNVGIPIEGSNGNQIAVGIIQDGSDIIVSFIDSVLDSYFIERVINSNKPDMLHVSNFDRIECDEQWNEYFNFFKNEDCIPARMFV